jgi:hypothetical protein
MAVNYVKLIKTMFDTLCPDWRSKLISINSDGENTMTNRHGGVVTLLEKECNNLVLRIWCVSHQLDIVVKNATQDDLDQAFYKVAHAYSVHLQVQQNLITDMGSKCMKDTMCWVAFGSILHWLLQNLSPIDDPQCRETPRSGTVKNVVGYCSCYFTIV